MSASSHPLAQAAHAPHRAFGTLPRQRYARAVPTPRQVAGVIALGMRKASGNTVAELAEAQGLGASKLGRIERGDETWGMDRVLRLAPAGIRWVGETLVMIADIQATPANGQNQLSLFSAEWL